MPMGQVKKILTEVQKLVETRTTEVDFHRVYIPKNQALFEALSSDMEKYFQEGGKIRPLGVPTKA